MLWIERENSKSTFGDLLQPGVNQWDKYVSKSLYRLVQFNEEGHASTSFSSFSNIKTGRQKREVMVLNF